jgi:hypothetical protein
MLITFETKDWRRQRMKTGAQRRRSMNRILSALGLALIALTAVPMSVGSAQAVVYCTTTGYPRGCVVRPVAPVARAAAIHGVLGYGQAL